MAGGADVGGWRTLRKQLRKGGDDLADLKEANTRAASIASSAIKGLAPRVSGALAATVRSSGTKTAGVVRVGNNSKVRYAGPIVWGWGRRGIKANPFTSKGARKSEPVWTRVYASYIDRIIQQIKGL